MKITVEWHENEYARGRIDLDDGKVITFTGEPDSVLEPEPTSFVPDFSVIPGGGMQFLRDPGLRYALTVKGIRDVAQYADASLVPGYGPPKDPASTD